MAGETLIFTEGGLKLSILEIPRVLGITAQDCPGRIPRRRLGRSVGC